MISALFISLLVLMQVPASVTSPGVKVSGQVIGWQAQRGSKVEMQSSDRSRPSIVTDINADGTFQFQAVPKGVYSASIRGFEIRMGSLRTWYLAVDNQDVHSVQFRLADTGSMSEGYGFSPVGNAPIAKGTVVIRDLSNRVGSELPAGVLVTVSGGIPSIAAVGKDGSFSIPVDSGNHTVALVGLPAGYSVQAITSNAVDLMKSPLFVEGRKPPADIQILLEYRQP